MLTETEHLNSTQAAARLKVSRETLRNWVERGLIAYERLPNGRVRFSEADLAAAVKRHEPAA